MRLKTLNQKMEYLRNGVRYCLLLILLVLAFATGAHAAQDDYYYPNYDASANGCVDLMNYVKRVTVTVNGVDYTLNQLDQMRQQGTPLTMQVGDTISFNVLFGLQGRAYDQNDATLVDESNSTYVTYTHDTTMLDGTTVAAGSQAILDDSSLMKENTTKGNSYLRMDIGWLLDACPGNYNFLVLVPAGSCTLWSRNMWKTVTPATSAAMAASRSRKSGLPMTATTARPELC